MLQLFWKETPTQVFSSEICEMFKNIYFEEHLLLDVINACLVSVLILHLLKILENQRFYGVFRG